MFRYYILFILLIFGGDLSAQLPTDGLTYRDLLKCDIVLSGSVNKIVQTKSYHTGDREKTRYFFGRNNQIKSIDNSNGVEVNYEYDSYGNVNSQVVRQDGIIKDSLVGIYFDEKKLRGLMTYRGNDLNLVSVQQVVYNRRDQPERIRIDEIIFFPESNSAGHHSAWQDLKWKNEKEFSVDFININQSTKYIAKNVNKGALSTEDGCLLKQEDGRRTINDVKGRTTVEIYQVEEDPEADKVLVEYEYDERGNWIAQRHYAISDGERARKKRRVLDVRRKIDYND